MKKYLLCLSPLFLVACDVENAEERAMAADPEPVSRTITVSEPKPWLLVIEDPARVMGMSNGLAVLDAAGAAERSID